LLFGGLRVGDKATTIADMKRVKAISPIFLLLLLIAIFILFFFQNPLTAGLQTITLPIQRWVFMASARPNIVNDSEQQLQQENNQLRIQLAQIQEIQSDNQALYDQFQVTTPAPQHLLPVDVVGLQQNALLIDKGQEDNVHVGDVVVFKNNLIGTVNKITPHISLVTLLADPSTSFTAESVKTNADGIVRSEDSGIVTLDNVVLSDKLQINDIVVTKGDQNAQGQGYPPRLVVGEIVSVDKQASSLFQSAKLESLIDLSQLRIVFVITQQ
jgi:cell shape-determining protein MreC